MFSNPLYKSVIHVYLTGGEPFLSSRLVDICQILKTRLNPTISLNTNGLLPDKIESYSREILDMHLDILSFDLSINGPEPIHDYTRGVSGAFSKLMESRQVLENLGIPYGWNFTIFKPTISSILWYRNFRKDKNEPKHYAFGLPKKFLGSPSEDQFAYTEQDLSEIYSNCGNLSLRLYLDYIKYCKYFLPCYMGSHQIRVFPNGESYVCEYDPHFYLGYAPCLTPKEWEGNVRQSKYHCKHSCSLEYCIYAYNQIMSKPMNRLLLRKPIYPYIRRVFR